MDCEPHSFLALVRGPIPCRSESPTKVTEKEATMELAMRLNVLAALLSFGFIAAIVFGVI